MQAGTQASDWDKHKQSHFSRLSHSTREKKFSLGAREGRKSRQEQARIRRRTSRTSRRKSSRIKGEMEESAESRNAKRQARKRTARAPGREARGRQTGTRANRKAGRESGRHGVRHAGEEADRQSERHAGSKQAGRRADGSRQIARGWRGVCGAATACLWFSFVSATDASGGERTAACTMCPPATCSPSHSVPQRRHRSGQPGQDPAPDM